MFTIDLTNKNAVVIAGARGIGAAAGKCIVQAGGRVAWTYLGIEADIAGNRAVAAALQALGGEGFSRVVDCTDSAATEAFVQAVVQRWGGLDYLVYCAGYTSPTPFLDITPADWRKLVDINLNGAFIAAHAAIPHMKKRGGGSIVIVGSAAIVAGGGGRADYVSAKAGLEGLNRAITKEFAPQGIRCNLVHPSLIETDLLKQRHPDPAKRAELAREVPLRRLGQPEDIAHAMIFLLSDRAAYITGQSLYVDGGRTFCK